MRRRLPEYYQQASKHLGASYSESSSSELRHPILRRLGRAAAGCSFSGFAGAVIALSAVIISLRLIPGPARRLAVFASGRRHGEKEKGRSCTASR